VTTGPTSKALYRSLCEAEPTLSLFHQAWWLDATCGTDGWDVAIVEKGGAVHAAMPFVVKARRGMVVISQPELTQFIGPWIRDTGAKRSHDYGRQKDLMQALIAALPRYDHFQQNWSPTATNWLPFYWAGFKQTTRYTYRLANLDDQAALRAGFRENIRGDIRKAEGRSAVTISIDATIDDFLKLNALTFARQGRAPSVSEAYMRAIDGACAERGCRAIVVARGPDGRPHAGAYIVWGSGVAYYLMGGGDPELRNSGATSLCMAKAIEISAKHAKVFDFEGSMMEPVERFFRAFGAVQTPLFQITRTPSRLIRAYLAAQDLLGRT
jgi:CelD/BcsL family acetyltransferase involved in cellulose biosynthesis